MLELEISNEKFRSFYNNSPDMILSVSAANSNILSCNDKVLQLTGFSNEEIIGFSVFRIYDDDCIDKAKEAFQQFINTGKIRDIELLVKKKAGGAIDVSLNADAVRDRKGKILYSISAWKDISERKLAEEELKLYRENLERLVKQRTAELEIEKERALSADRFKSAFLATMSHELRTPLNSIIGFTGVLLKERPGPVNEEQKKQLGMVQNSARHLLSLINDVLDISKIEAGQLNINIERFNISPVINKVIENSRSFAEKKNLQIYISVASGVINIYSDKLRVEQILLNLVNNAIKFTEAGSVSIECSLIRKFVIIKVIDTGIGIEKEQMEKIFKPFTQIDPGLTRKFEGTGLGLSICKKLLDLLNGSIEVESQPGVGSTFIVKLPSENGKQKNGT
jgi:PAS domain S-box-containing protein